MSVVRDSSPQKYFIGLSSTIAAFTVKQMDYPHLPTPEQH